MTSNYICNHIQIRYSSKKKFKSDITPSFKPVINNGYKTIADTLSFTNTFMSWLMAINQALNFQLRHNGQRRSTDLATTHRLAI